ncbi:MAG: hypothetical protein WB678_01780 [Stellaceae bacterium]
MNDARTWRRANLIALGALILGAVASILGAVVDPAGFFPAWLCAFLLWLGVPLGALTLVLVHDLTDGRWMAAARPALNAAIATMPLAVLAGIPAFISLHELYRWTHPAPSLGNTFYLNREFFLFRYLLYAVLWNVLAGYALWAPRGEATPISPALSWLSGIGLLVLAFSASFAAIDWVLSLEPTVWSSVFPMIAGAGWFNTGLALVVLVVALSAPPAAAPSRAAPDPVADLAAILLATTIFWAYVEFCQFLIIWEENLRFEIPWYLTRWIGIWRPTFLVDIGLGFVLPFFVLLWGPCKRSRRIVAATSVLILVSRVADTWWLVLPEFRSGGPFWLDAGTILALGAVMALLFLNRLRWGGLASGWRLPAWKAGHG